MESEAAILEAREKLKQKFASSGRIGGKGSVRRKHKAVHKVASTDDKRLTATIKRLNCNPIPAIEEVVIFKDDGSAIQFNNPKLQASIAANTFVVSGPAENKTFQEMLPAYLSGGGMNAASMKLLQELAKGAAGGAGAGKLDSLMSALGGAEGGEEDAMPELVGGDFEAVSEK